MFSPFKLEQLPPVQRARKLFKVFLEADKRCQRGDFPADKASYVRELSLCARLLSEDDYYALHERETFKSVARELEAAWNGGTLEISQRSVSNIRHILGRVVGKMAADWDFESGPGNPDLQVTQRIMPRKVFPGLAVYFEDTRSPFNVGAMFRTAECFGVERIYVSPLCASPEHPRAARSAMGCVELVPWEIARLDQIALPVFALETGGCDIHEFEFPEKGIMITGSEELGASNEALSLADSSLGRVSIPLYGQKASLNVSVAFGIAMEYWARALANKGK